VDEPNVQNQGIVVPFESEMSINVQPDIIIADESIRGFDSVKKDI
jgi:hypothetical protein